MDHVSWIVFECCYEERLVSSLEPKPKGTEGEEEEDQQQQQQRVEVEVEVEEEAEVEEVEQGQRRQDGAERDGWGGAIISKDRKEAERKIKRNFNTQ